MACVYMITSPSGKRYIGETKRKLRKRLERHKDLKWSHCRALVAAIEKYGWDAMKVEVLWEGADSERKAKEKELIALHGTFSSDDYNCTPGGESNPMDTAEGRASIAKTWADPCVRSKHIAGTKAAWDDPSKRANIMAGRAKSEKVALAKAIGKHNGAAANSKRTATWEEKREARLAGLTGKARAQKLARLNRDRERHRKKVLARTADTMG
jgi:group I intron endonuclease